jgi:hypothetical protein
VGQPFTARRLAIRKTILGEQRLLVNREALVLTTSRRSSNHV